MKQCRSLLLAAGAALALVAPGRADDGPKLSYGVYEYVTHLPAGSLAEAADRLHAAAEPAGYTLLAESATGAPEGCTYGARVFVLYRPELAREVLAINSTTGPFTVVDRVVLFEDENGVHAGIVNPRCLDRTVLMDDPRGLELAGRRLHALRAAVAGALGGTIDSTAYGENRDRGYIGKTMGVMAGGKFSDKIDDLVTIPGADWQQVALRVSEGLAEPGPKWGVHRVYELPFPEQQAMLIGVSGAYLEQRSFEIVGAGSEDKRDDLKCPGLAHAAAYPLELVVRNDHGTVKVQMVSAMFRMKMYFEDAGKWAFMKNMGMPGSIADEMKARIGAALPDTSGSQ